MPLLQPQPLIEIHPVLDWNDLEQVARLADPLAKVTGFLTVMGIPHRVVNNGLPATSEPEVETPPPAKAATPKKASAAAKPKANPAPAPEPAAEDPFPDDAPAAVEAIPERTDEEKKGRALALLRHVYTAPGGGADAVKKLQKSRKVAKFSDVSLDDAPMLLVEAEKLAAQFNVVLPQVLSP